MPWMARARTRHRVVGDGEAAVAAGRHRRQRAHVDRDQRPARGSAPRPHRCPHGSGRCASECEERTASAHFARGRHCVDHAPRVGQPGAAEEVGTKGHTGARHLHSDADVGGAQRGRRRRPSRGASRGPAPGACGCSRASRPAVSRPSMLRRRAKASVPPARNTSRSAARAAFTTSSASAAGSSSTATSARQVVAAPQGQHPAPAHAR